MGTMRLQALLIYLVSIVSKMVAGTYLAYFNEHSKGGIELAQDNQIRTKELENVTMCFKFQLFDAKAHCLFDVTSIQLLYLHPYNPGYGILRIKNKADRTVVFSPLQTFQVKKWYQVSKSSISSRQMQNSLGARGVLGSFCVVSIFQLEDVFC